MDYFTKQSQTWYVIVTPTNSANSFQYIIMPSTQMLCLTKYSTRFLFHDGVELCDRFEDWVLTDCKELRTTFLISKGTDLRMLTTKNAPSWMQNALTSIQKYIYFWAKITIRFMWHNCILNVHVTQLYTKRSCDTTVY